MILTGMLRTTTQRPTSLTDVFDLIDHILPVDAVKVVECQSQSYVW